MIVVIVFILLGNQFQKKAVQTVEVNKENFDVVDSYEKVQYYSRLGENYRGRLLVKAEKYDLLQQFENAEIPVMESNRTFKIHQVWNVNEEFHLIYSVNLLPNDKKPQDIPYMTFGDILLHNKENQQARISVDPYETDPNNSHNMTSNTGFLLDDRFYRSIWIKGRLGSTFHEEIMEWDEPDVLEGDAVQARLEDVKEVTFSNLKMINKEFEMNDIDPLKLEMNLTTTDNPLQSFGLNEKAKLTANTTLSFKRYEVGINGEKLFIDIGENHDQIRELTYLMNGEEIQSPIHVNENGEQFLYANYRPIESEVLRIHFTEASVPNDEQVSYTLSQKHMEKFQAEMSNEEVPPMMKLNEEFGMIKDGHRFSALNLDVRNSHHQDKIAVVLNVQIAADALNHNSYRFIDYGEYLQYRDITTNAFVDVTNDNNERIELLGINRIRSSKGFIINLEIDKEDFMEQEELNLRFFHFSEKSPLDTDLIEIPILAE